MIEITPGGPDSNGVNPDTAPFPQLIRPTMFDAVIANAHLDCLEEAGITDVPFNKPHTIDIDAECLIRMSKTSPDNVAAINNNIIWLALPLQRDQLMRSLELGEVEGSLQRIDRMQRLLSKLDEGVRLIAGIPQELPQPGK